ncbi:transcriptional regulator [Candidatus Pacearchaeota archaeon]|nr:transcriptional regulator [Candidatus Pacearchaeota archaeon]|tara:strand:- start:1624 stop:1836 length:213 start_codon:yes stop_codon:yes gene_type:complete
MPLYEYRCKECKHKFDEIKRFDDPNPPCAKCSSLKVTKLISQTSFALKGGGWYKDHYGLKPSKSPKQASA